MHVAAPRRASSEEDTGQGCTVRFRTKDSSNTGVHNFPSDREPQLQAVGPISSHIKESYKQLH